MNYAQSQGCVSIQLDSDLRRVGAHRFYFQKGMAIAAFRFSLMLRNIGQENIWFNRSQSISTVP
ncbi:MAG: hypothetical protein F6K19_15380 [Cyanothece sp. SIO1E1]|nr:hypothetical protein [Cyanothece sp. SIO1E1]